MSFIVVFEPEAKLKIISAFNWYEEQSFGLGGEFFRAIKQSEAALMRNPFIYQVQYKEVRRAYVEPGVVSVKPDDRLQFERHGYFVANRVDSVLGKPVFNRVTTLKDGWGK